MEKPQDFNLRESSSLSDRVLAGAQRVAVEPRYFAATSVPPTSSRLLATLRCTRSVYVQCTSALQ